MVYGWMMWFGLVALAGSFVHAWRVVNLRTAGAVKKIAIDRHARLPCLRRRRRAGRGVGRCDDADSLRFVLQWNADGKTIRQCVTPDMADKESYRRLKVWARWCQAQNAGHPLLIQQGDFPPCPIQIKPNIKIVHISSSNRPHYSEATVSDDL